MVFILFRCKNCSAVLNGEYMGKDGIPYCEKCYQKSFGVKCAYCNRFISGKVLQAGENHHFHPTCARCTKCGDPFGDGEEMYLQGSAIWHPRCGPGPSAELGGGTILNGTNGHLTDTECDRLSNSAMSEMQVSSFKGGHMTVFVVRWLFCLIFFFTWFNNFDTILSYNLHDFLFGCTFVCRFFFFAVFVAFSHTQSKWIHL